MHTHVWESLLETSRSQPSLHMRSILSEFLSESLGCYFWFCFGVKATQVNGICSQGAEPLPFIIAPPVLLAPASPGGLVKTQSLDLCTYHSVWFSRSEVGTKNLHVYQVLRFIGFLGCHKKSPKTKWLKTTEIYSHSFGGYRSEIKLSSGWYTLWRVWGDPFLVSSIFYWLPAIPGGPWLIAASPQPSVFTRHFLCVFT